MRLFFLALLALVAATYVSGLSMGRQKMSMSTTAKKNVLIVGGTRFSGLYLWEELHNRGHSVTLYNRGKTALKKIPGETDAQFEARKADTNFVKGDRKDTADMKSKLGGLKFDVVYDMGGREAADTEPLVDLFGSKAEQFVYMSSAGVYKKSLTMPHFEGDAEDPKSRHKGKLETEAMLRLRGVPFTSIRPTYIYGPLNYNPLEEWFFTRLDAGKPICIPGHGQHLTGLGHVKDLAVAMANVIGRDKTKGKIYNVQDAQSVTFEGLAKLCANAMGMKGDDVKIKLYDKKMFDFGEKKAFPMREQHFFCGIDQAMADLDWKPQFDMAKGLKDSFESDFKIKKAAGKLNLDFETDDKIINDQRIAAEMFDAIPKSK
jgi:nucleoside-diphosphate-sugar epimerase